MRCSSRVTAAGAWVRSWSRAASSTSTISSPRCRSSSSCPLIDLRRTSPTEEALKALPEAVVRGDHRAADARRREGVAVAMAGPPTPEVLARARSGRGRADQRGARARARHPPAHRPLVPRHGGHGPDRRGVRGRRVGTRRTRHGDSSTSTTARPSCRWSAHPHRGGARPRVRHPHRAAGHAAAHPLPRRRRAARRHARCPASMAQALVSRIKIMAEMNIVERRRAQDGQFEATVDGRAPRRARRHHRRRSGARRRCCGSSTRAARCSSSAASGMPPETRDRVLAAHPLAVRHGDLRRPDRERQDHDALRGADRDQRRRRATSRRSKTRSST